MRSEDLIKFNIRKQWAKARIKFFEDQKETIGRLNSVLSDMPKGSRKVQDNEVESLVILLDKMNEIIKEIEEYTIKIESDIQKQLDILKPRYGLLLYHHYILGDSIKYIAKEILHYEEKYTYTLKKEALEEFDKLGKSNDEVSL